RAPPHHPGDRGRRREDSDRLRGHPARARADGRIGRAAASGRDEQGPEPRRERRELRLARQILARRLDGAAKRVTGRRILEEPGRVVLAHRSPPTRLAMTRVAPLRDGTPAPALAPAPIALAGAVIASLRSA